MDRDRCAARILSLLNPGSPGTRSGTAGPHNPLTTDSMRLRALSLLLPALLLFACSSPSELAQSDAADAATFSTPQEPGTQEPGADPDRARWDAQRDKKRVLAATYVELGDDAFARGDYQGAAAHYAEANSLDAGNVAARDGLRRAQSALAGKPYDLDSAEDVIGNLAIRDAQRRVKVEGFVREGDRAMASADFEGALAAYAQALDALQYSPDLAVGMLETSLVEGKYKEAQAALGSSESAARAAETAAAERRNEETRQAREEYHANVINTLYSEANQEFQRGFYDKSVAKLDSLLRLDPRNEDALELRDIANQAAHAARESRTATEFATAWETTFTDVRTELVPHAGPIEHDLAYWTEVVSKRQPLDSLATAEEADPVRDAIMASLNSTRMIARFEDQAIEDIAQNLSSLTGVNFIVSRAVREEIDEETKTIRLTFKDARPISDLLRIMEDMMQGQVRFVVRYGAVHVVTEAEADTDVLTLQYEVRDIVRPISDFLLPEINLSPSGGIESEEEELPEVEANILTEDELVETIQSVIEPDSWDGEKHNVSIENGTLVVRHRREVLTKVSQLLEDLRRPANIMVEITVRFLRVEDSFLEDIGVDWRGLGDDSTVGVPGQGTNDVFDDFGSDFGSPGDPGAIGSDNDTGFNFREADDNVNVAGRTENLYDTALGSDSVLTNSGGLSLQYTWLDDAQVEMVLRAVQKSKRSELVIAPKLMVYNTARANLVVANQVSYVADFDVEIASAAAIADPIVRVANDGVYLDVRPVVTADRRFVWVDVRPTVATLLRPIPTFQTSLGTGSPVTLMLPELELQKIRTRAFVPDGGTLLLGGMTLAEQQELQSGVPYLDRIPVLSFFFSRKGTFESYRKLIILLTARIILPRESEPEPLPGGF